MSPFEQINSTPILDLIQSLGLSYKKNGTGYILVHADGRIDKSFSINITENYIYDFGKTGVRGSPFDFVGMYILGKSYEDMRTSKHRAETANYLLEKGLVKQDDEKPIFKKAPSHDELMSNYNDYTLKGYKPVVGSWLQMRGVEYSFIQKNQLFIGELFRDIAYVDNYYCEEEPGMSPENVKIFIFPMYNKKKERVGMKLRRLDGKNIRGVKSYTVGKVGVIYDEITTGTMYITEGEPDYIIMRLLGYNNVIGNIGGVGNNRKILKQLLYETDKVVALYDNDEAGEKGIKALSQTLGVKVYTVDLPVKETNTGERVKDVNDLYKVGYDTKDKWDKILIKTKTLDGDDKEQDKYPFIYLRSSMEYYDTEYKKIQDISKVAHFLGKAPTEMRGLRLEGHIKTYTDLCYREGGRKGYYNTLDPDSYIKNGGEEEPLIHDDIKYLIDNIGGHRKKNIDWIHGAILFKLTHINNVHVPALILYGQGGSGKGSFLNLLSKIFGQENTQVGLGQDDLESQFSSYQGEKLIVEFKEVSSDNKAQDKKNLDKIKGIISEPRLSINTKYRDSREVENIAWFHLSSNHAIPLQMDSKHSGNRRFTVIKTGGKLNESRARYMNEVTFNDIRIIKQYINWLYENFPNVIDMINYPALENVEKENLVNSCESGGNQFFEWFEKKYPYITRISKKQKNKLLLMYCDEEGEDERDLSFRQKNFDINLSHRYEVKTVRIGDKVVRGYSINKTNEELNRIPEGEKGYFTDTEFNSLTLGYNDKGYN